MWNLTCDTWHVTHALWRMVHGLGVHGLGGLDPLIFGWHNLWTAPYGDTPTNRQTDGRTDEQVSKGKSNIRMSKGLNKQPTNQSRDYRAFQIFQSMAGLGRIGNSGVRQFVWLQAKISNTEVSRTPGSGFFGLSQQHRHTDTRIVRIKWIGLGLMQWKLWSPHCHIVITAVMSHCHTVPLQCPTP
jgi:hypothetical protein